MTNRQMQRLKSNHVAKVIAGLMYVMPAAIGLIGVAVCRAQSQAANAGEIKSETFEVASIKPVESFGFDSMVRIAFEEGQLVVSNCPAELILELAFGAEERQIIGAPEWVHSARYEVLARIDGATAERLRHLSSDQRKLAHQHMVQALLADRFMLSLHHENRELPIYSLVVAKGGPRLTPATPGQTYSNGPHDAAGIGGPHTIVHQSSLNSEQTEWTVQLTGQAASMDVLLNKLKIYFQRKIIDNTGVAGEFDFKVTFKWPLDRRGMENDDDLVPGSAGPDIFTALQQQLGLRLEPRKGPVDVLVIDHIERPSAN